MLSVWKTENLPGRQARARGGYKVVGCCELGASIDQERRQAWRERRRAQTGRDEGRARDHSAGLGLCFDKRTFRGLCYQTNTCVGGRDTDSSKGGTPTTNGPIITCGACALDGGAVQTGAYSGAVVCMTHGHSSSFVWLRQAGRRRQCSNEACAAHNCQLAESPVGMRLMCTASALSPSMEALLDRVLEELTVDCIDGREG